MKLTAHKKKEEINLLPKSGFSSTTSGRVLSWLLSTFRVIVIVTEILVMVAFLSRFWLDAQNSDLNDQMRQKKNLLETYTNFEKDLADTQKRIEIYSLYTQNSGDYTDVLGYLTSSLPPDVILTQLNLSRSAVQIEGVSPNERSIQQFISNIQSDQRFSGVTIDNLQTGNQQSEQIIFELVAIRDL